MSIVINSIDKIIINIIRILIFTMIIIITIIITIVTGYPHQQAYILNCMSNISNIVY